MTSSQVLIAAALVAAVSGDICGETSKQKLWEGECTAGMSDEATQGPSCSCKAGKPHGKGTMRDLGISIFSGEYVDGQMEGLGVHAYSSGMTYKGTYKAGHWDGLGSLMTIAGHYHGEYKNGRQNGLGATQTVKKEHYAGEWKDGKKNGLGSMDFERSNKYVGNWANNKRIGCGVYYQSTAHVLLGDALGLKRKAGRWVPCVLRDECLFDFWCDCMTDGVKLQKHAETGKVSPADLQCADEAEEQATQKQALAMEVAERAKLQAAGAPAPADMKFGTVTEEAPKVQADRVEPEGVSYNILEDSYSSFYILGFMLAIQAIFPPKMQHKISVFILLCVILSILKTWGPHYSIQFLTGGKIKRQEADAFFAKLPERIRPALYVPQAPRHDEL